MTRADTCAMCEHFTLDGGKPDEGIGRCIGYGESNPEPLVRWDRKFCVLFWRAQNMDKREQFIAKRRREEGGNAAAA
jgi:hypothetical protein